ncbi:hypothetical protein C8Q76DRAFT_651029 [Earliella scabrosa]|nr:hypothetical protein C8Q76DRAFT_651029 [Earliella scabrosa]
MAAPSQRPAKRARTTSDAPAVERHPEVWLSDGNIIVVSRQVAFRVHKSILSHHSEIFRDLFSLPDQGADEMMEGCPVVRLDADDPIDLQRLFLVLCCGKNYYSTNDEILPVSVDILASLIRMGHKYAIPSVLTHALSRLKRYYTSDLKAWDDPEERARYVDATPLDAIDVIQLAHLTDTPSILPTAYLISCGLIHSSYTAPGDKAGQLVLRDFQNQDLLRIMGGYTQLLQAAADRILPLASVVGLGMCTTRTRCAVNSIELLRARHLDRSVFKKLDHRGALGPLDTWFLKHPTARLCSACDAKVRQLDALYRANAWSKLPLIFQLDLTPGDWPSEKLDVSQA